jgi:NAD(P)-dependent dehydrogenase (short-subunit alcohol dehydrogenase family)
MPQEERMISDWLGRIAVVTGGATGIGFALANALTRGGVDCRNPPEFERFLERIVQFK